MFDFSIDYTDTGAEPPPLFTSPSKNSSPAKAKLPSALRKRNFSIMSHASHTHQPPSKQPLSLSKYQTLDKASPITKPLNKARQSQRSSDPSPREGKRMITHVHDPPPAQTNLVLSLSDAHIAGG